MENTVKHFNNFNATELTITGTKINKTMIIKFINKCPIQTPWITLNAYGVRKITEYLKPELDGAFIKVPLDDSEFKYKLIEIDRFFGSEGFKQDNLGVDYAKYTYVPLVKTPEDKQPYIKLKLNVYQDFDDFNIETHVYKLCDGVKEFVHCLCMDAVVRAVKFNSDIRLIISPAKLWVVKGNKTYGLTCKVNKIEVKETQKKTFEFLD